MSKQFLVYWNWKDNDLDHWEGAISHAGSDQFHRVSAGDWLWFVGVPPDSTRHSSGSLILLGRMRVAEVLPRDEARRRLGTDDIWQHAKLHALADPYSVAGARMIDITHLATSLRFQSENDRFAVVDGRINPQQLQSMRHLTPESVEMLQTVWEQSGDRDDEYPSRFVGPPLQPDVEYEDDLRVFTQAVEKEDFQYPEGRQILVEHLKRERNRSLVKAAKLAFWEAHGWLFCEACDFDFSAVYGDLGEGYIEAHHKVPISQLRPDATTRIDDLAMVCANCHRMLHASDPLLTVEELRVLLQQVRDET